MDYDKTPQQEMMEKEIGRIILSYANELKLDVNRIVEEQCLTIVTEITKIIQSATAYPDDQELVEQIMSVLHRYGISTGVCHDY